MERFSGWIESGVVYLKNLEMVAGWLLVLGGLSLGLEALMNYSLLGTLLGEGSMLERLVNLAVGASAVWMAYVMLNTKKRKK